MKKELTTIYKPLNAITRTYKLATSKELGSKYAIHNKDVKELEKNNRPLSKVYIVTGENNLKIDVKETDNPVLLEYVTKTLHEDYKQRFTTLQQESQNQHTKAPNAADMYYKENHLK